MARAGGWGGGARAWCCTCAASPLVCAAGSGIGCNTTGATTGSPPWMLRSGSGSAKYPVYQNRHRNRNLQALRLHRCRCWCQHHANFSDDSCQWSTVVGMPQ